MYLPDGTSLNDKKSRFLWNRTGTEQKIGDWNGTGTERKNWRLERNWNGTKNMVGTNIWNGTVIYGLFISLFLSLFIILFLKETGSGSCLVGQPGHHI